MRPSCAESSRVAAYLSLFVGLWFRLGELHAPLTRGVRARSRDFSLSSSICKTMRLCRNSTGTLAFLVKPLHLWVSLFLYLSITHLIRSIICLADGIFFGGTLCHRYASQTLLWPCQTYRGILPAPVLRVFFTSTPFKFLRHTPSCLSATTLSSFGRLSLRLGFTSFPTVYGRICFHLIYSGIITRINTLSHHSTF